MRMDGKNALITGASTGLGFAMAKAFAEAGANVAMVARRQSVLDEARAAVAAAANTRVVAVSADVSTAAGCEAAFRGGESGIGPIDVLVNNAGHSAAHPFEKVTDAEWQADIDLKLFAAIRLCRLVLPGMRARHFGRIINVLAVGAKAPRAASTPTTVSRAAGMALTKAISAEVAADNVLVNALLVGNIESDQFVRRAKAAGRPIQDLHDELGARIPIGRIGKAEEFANLALFLASDRGTYVTGTAINVDGGLSPVV
jgi:NAD(P)-dependent dehydrogenase (short-subunit alcohol dehydrogenase family)